MKYRRAVRVSELAHAFGFPDTQRSSHLFRFLSGVESGVRFFDWLLAITDKMSKHQHQIIGMIETADKSKSARLRIKDVSADAVPLKAPEDLLSPAERFAEVMFNHWIESMLCPDKRTEKMQ